MPELKHYEGEPEDWTIRQIIQRVNTMPIIAPDGSLMDKDGQPVGGGVIALVANDQSNANYNRTLIESTITEGKPVVLLGARSDVYYIDRHISLPDFATLLTEGPAIKMKDGVSDYVIGTQAEATAYSNVTVTWVSGQKATVSWPGHGCTYGDAVVLQGVVGTTFRKWFDVVRVQSVTDANNFVVTLEWLPTAAPTGAITAKRCNRGITLRAKVDHNYSGGNTGDGRTRMATVMSFISDSTVEVTGTDNTAKYICLLAGAMNVSGSVKGEPKTASDTLKFYGPMRNVRLHASGNSADEDCATFQPYEPPAFIAYMPSLGEINGVTLDRPDAVTGGGSGAIVVYSDSQFAWDGITVRDGRALSTGTTQGLRIRQGEGTPTTDLNGTLVIDGTAIGSLGGNAIQINSTRAKQIRFTRTRITPPPNNSIGRVMEVDIGCSLRRLAIEDQHLDLSNWAATTDWPIIISGQVDVLSFRGCTILGSTAARLVKLNTSAAVLEVEFIDCNVSGFDKLLESIATTSLTPTRVSIRSGYYKVNNLVASKISNVNVEIGAGVIVDGATLGVLRYDTASTSGQIIDNGCRLINSSVLLTGVNGGAVAPFAPRATLDIGSTAVARAAGAECIALTPRGTIPSGAPVISDGTKWVSKIDPTLTYT